MDQLYLKKIYERHQNAEPVPTSKEVGQFFHDLLSLLFPELSEARFTSRLAFEDRFHKLRRSLHLILVSPPNQHLEESKDLSNAFCSILPTIDQMLQMDIDAMEAGDPAAKSRSEIIRTYPGFVAIAAYRFAHELHKLGIALIPRMITEFAHGKTGIDIHPGARIGSHFCIDHGTGIVIGETTDIGNHVKIYQGVTLGALSVNKSDASKKRHPSLEDNVVIYAGATILGGKTVIGHNSTVGGNVWLTKSVPPYSKTYYRKNPQSQNQKSA